MDRQDQERQEVDRIMRRAAQLGYDPAQVEWALGHGPAPPTAYQPVMKVESRAWLGARFARRLTRRS